MTKRKLYWILMPPFLITSILLLTLLPFEYRYYAYLVIVAFWVVYYSCRFVLAKKNKLKS
ncbi:hypothetical protein FN924_15825 [Radiobacillus deserti]|uniref:Uncharacterized protein n=1 Tax=Radiobacillus deserti TaxID=2594883 RepID=A0A516KJF8_9BACI|nr:hypothetical protein FN924_15825 [Radiobacillus deserti]